MRALGTVTFLLGQKSQPVYEIVMCLKYCRVNVRSFVNLTLPTNATISDGQGQGTIVNDDTQPTIVISDVSANRSEERRVGKEFRVTLSTDHSQKDTVQ